MKYIKSLWRWLLSTSPSLRRFVFARSLKQEYQYDLSRYAKALTASQTYERRRAKLVLEYHKIEKGLALTSPRPGFGIATIEFLIEELPKYAEDFGMDEAYLGAIAALIEYQQYSQKMDVETPNIDAFLNLVDQQEHESEQGISEGGGTKALDAVNFEAAQQVRFDLFAKSRSSIRSFSDQPVPLDTVHEAVEVARWTPSVCNRQGWHVHIYTDKTSIENVLEFQSGNRGFTEEIPMLMVVTSDLRMFFGVNERNQAYVDGGMFSMSLVYALHSQGLGTCCLNLSVKNSVGDSLRRVGSIPENEALMMCIAVGYPSDKARAAYSARRNTEKFFTVHE